MPVARVPYTGNSRLRRTRPDNFSFVSNIALTVKKKIYFKLDHSNDDSDHASHKMQVAKFKNQNIYVNEKEIEK